MSKENQYILNFKKLSIKDINQVGGKNASLGEIIQNLQKKGIKVPGGFATTTKAYWDVLDENNIRQKLSHTLQELDTKNFNNLGKISTVAKKLILKSEFPKDLQSDITNAYKKLCNQTTKNVSVAVRSSATAEDLPGVSFAGQQETYLNISGIQALLEACKKCMASLFTERAIKYRIDNGFDHMNVALSIGVQQMVRADKGCSGIAFTLEPDTGFRDAIVINGTWGLGENIVQGAVDPDEFVVFKPSLRNNKESIISKKLGEKQKTLVYSKKKNHRPDISVTNTETSKAKREQYVLSDAEVKKIAQWSLLIEEHYKTPMDIEWAKDGSSNEIYILQARPETVHSINETPHLLHSYKLKEKGKIITRGTALGNKIASGKARILNSSKDSEKLKKGEVLVTDITNPDWDPIMKKAAAIVTNKGGRISHAAIVARELGVVAVVGAKDATEVIKDGQKITVSCAEGKNGMVYEGNLAWEEHMINTHKLKLPKTDVMFILANPDQAFKYSFLPNNGVGLLRMEFIINNSIRIHPMALVKFNELKDKEAKAKIAQLTKGYKSKTDYFIDYLSQAIATVAAAFYPKDVIVRMSDFKTNEYANLIGGKQFEPEEENPMLGFRGASRYYSPLYQEGFKLECEAVKIVRDKMGLTNVKLMIPFCRTVDEAKKVLGIMAQYGLNRNLNKKKKKESDLEIYTMIEIPSNVILAEEFAEVFDGFSIGSNDLTQLTLGLDRDSELMSSLFDENNPAVKKLISQVINVAKKKGVKIGLCGQAPSDFPEFAQFLVQEGIDSISFNPDAIVNGIKNIQKAEKRLQSN